MDKAEAEARVQVQLEAWIEALMAEREWRGVASAAEGTGARVGESVGGGG